jgi:hypothetical protein
VCMHVKVSLSLYLYDAHVCSLESIEKCTKYGTSIAMILVFFFKHHSRVQFSNTYFKGP